MKAFEEKSSSAFPLFIGVSVKSEKKKENPVLFGAG